MKPLPSFDRRARPTPWPAPAGSVLPVEGLFTRNRDIANSWWTASPSPHPDPYKGDRTECAR